LALQRKGANAAPGTRIRDPRVARHTRKREGSEKALPSDCVDLARKETGYIPTPPRTTTKLFDATCGTAPPALGENRRGIECAGP